MFSVVIPVYNKAETISMSLDSVLGQTCRDYEIIVVDDGSTDGLDRVLDRYRGRVRVVRQKNQGVSAARNRGIGESRGEHICFLDADDEWLPDHLASLAEAIRRYPQDCFFSTLYRQVRPDGTQRSKLPLLNQKEPYLPIDDYIGLVLRRRHTFINTDTVCIAASLLAAEGFAVGETKGEDTDLWYRIAAKHRLILVRKETALYHQEYSTATADGFHPPQWRFAAREPELLADPQISAPTRRSIAKLIERWRCACFREALLAGDRREARARLKTLREPLSPRGLFCYFLFCLPRGLVRALIGNRS